MAANKTNVTPGVATVDPVDAVETVHTDGTVNLVDTHALGGDDEQMPMGYFRSKQFIGTVIVICTGSICAYLG